MWLTAYEFPVSFPTDPLRWNDRRFDKLFVRTKIYDEADDYLTNIAGQYGKFWVSSPSGGYGKSTMLHYMSRTLLRKISDLKALPFHLHASEKLYDSVKHTFIKNFLDELSNLDRTLIQASKILDYDVPEEIGRTVIKGFANLRDKVREFRATLPMLSAQELEAKFYVALDQVLRPWMESGIFRKYVLLVDEMDKLDPNDVLTFLSGNQHLFERLYGDYGFVAYFSGHKSWVEKILEGTEYSYYHGKTFNLLPFVDLENIRLLIETRLMTYLYMAPADSPWTDDGFTKLREITGGVPRRLLEMVARVMNESYRRKTTSIGPGMVEETLVKEIYVDMAEEHLRTHFQTYMKLKQAIGKKADNLLYIFYEMPRHQVPKAYDRGLAERTRHLGVELSDEDWNASVRTLIGIECIQDGDVIRQLSQDTVDFFDRLSDCPAELGWIVPRILRRIGDLKPAADVTISPPDYGEIIQRILSVSTNEWLSTRDIFERFLWSTKFQIYLKQRKTKRPEELAQRIFDRELKEYLSEAEPALMVFADNNDVYYRKLAPRMSKADYEQLKRFRSRSVIDSYLDLVVQPSHFDWNNIRKIDGLLESILKLICRLKFVRFEDGVIRKKARHELFKRLELPIDLRRHLGYYIRESKDPMPLPGILKQTVRAAILSFSEIFDGLSVAPEEEISKEDFAMLREIEQALRKHIQGGLSSISDNWWRERVPSDVREHAKERKSGAEFPWPWYQERKSQLICYVDFYDYAKIILRRDNWRDVFRQTQKSRTQIQASLERLEPIRNAIAHNRFITEDQRRVLITERKFLCDSISAKQDPKML